MVVAVGADMALCDYSTTTVYDKVRNVRRPANGSDGKKDELPSGNKSSSEQQLDESGESMFGLPTSDL